MMKNWREIKLYELGLKNLKRFTWTLQGKKIIIENIPRP